MQLNCVNICSILQVKGVVVGFDPHLSYLKMIKASSYAKNPDNLFIATNEDSFLPTVEDVVIPGNPLPVIVIWWFINSAQILTISEQKKCHQFSAGFL